MNSAVTGTSEWKKYWFLPMAAALGYATSVIHVYSMGPFIEPLQAEFGWSRAQVSSGLSLSAIISALFCIPIGMLVDKVGPRQVGLIGAVLLLAAYAALGTATGSTANWVMLWCVLAVATFGVQTTVWTSAVTSRFEASRGLALAITLSGASVAATLFPVMTTWLIGIFSWRTAFMASSAIWGVVVLPVLFLCFRGAKDDIGSKAKVAGPVVVLPGVTFMEGIRMPALYKLLIAASAFTFTVIGLLVHFVPMLTGFGADPLKAAGAASLIGIFSIFGRLVAGFLLDHYLLRGISDLFVTDMDGNLSRLTNDRYADLLPSWSPDGSRIAFTTDRSGTDLDLLIYGNTRIAVMDVATHRIDVLPQQEDGKNINPAWSPDGLRWYTPERWIALALSLLVTAKVVWTLWQGWQAWQGVIPLEAWRATRATLFALGGLVLGQSLGYAWGLRWRLREGRVLRPRPRGR